MAISYTANKVEAPKQFVVPKGRYTLIVVEAKEDTSKKGNEMIILTFKVKKKDGTDGPKFTENLVFTPNAHWKIDQFLKACGEHPGDGQPIELDASEMIGWGCEADVDLVPKPSTKKPGTTFEVNEVAGFIYDLEDDFTK
jgi:hypothetical protein